VDSECKQGIVPQTSDEADKHPDVDAFNRALADVKPGATESKESKQITATFTGRFICKSGSSSPTRRRVIEIEQVSGLEVTKGKPKEQTETVDPKTGNLHLSIPVVLRPCDGIPAD
jgi:hypothetical protein